MLNSAEEKEIGMYKIICSEKHKTLKRHMCKCIKEVISPVAQETKQSPISVYWKRRRSDRDIRSENGFKPDRGYIILLEIWNVVFLYFV